MEYDLAGHNLRLLVKTKTTSVTIDRQSSIPLVSVSILSSIVTTFS